MDYEQLRQLRKTAEQYEQQDQYRYARATLKEILDYSRQSGDHLPAGFVEEVQASYDALPTRAKNHIKAGLDFVEGKLSEYTGNLDDITAVEATLEQLDSADIDDQHRPQIAALRLRAGKRRQEYEDEINVKTVEAQVRALWQEAEAKSKPGAGGTALTPETLLGSYYEPAIEMVENALKQYPTSARLATLASEAKRRREDKATLGQIYTSAVQGEQYAMELKRLREKDARELVPRYVFQDVVRDGKTEKTAFYEKEVTAEEAIRELATMAREWASGKLTEYIGQVESFLESATPELARAKLEEQKPKVWEFLNPDEQKKLNELETKVKEGIERLNTARARAIQAENALIDEDAVQALGVCDEAIKTYKAEEFIKLRQRILEQILVDLRGLEMTVRDAYERRDSEGVARAIESTKRYDGLDAALEPTLTRIRAYKGNMDDFTKRLTAARAQLRKLKEQINRRETAQASETLRAIEALEVEDVILFGRIKEELSELKAEYNRQATVEDAYQRVANWQGISSVKDAEMRLKEIGELQRQHKNDIRFEALAHKVRLRAAVLKAEDAIERRRLDEAGSALHDVLQDTGHEDYARAQSIGADLDVRLERDGVIRHKLRQLRTLISTNPQSAYEQLSGLRPEDSTSQSEHALYMQQAKDALRRKVTDTLLNVQRDWVRAVDQNPIEFSIQHVQDVRESLRVLETTLQDKSTAEQYQKVLRLLIATGDAVETANKREFERAIGAWETLLADTEVNANNSRRDLYAGKLRDIKRQHYVTRLQNAERRLDLSAQQTTGAQEEPSKALDEASEYGIASKDREIIVAAISLAKKLVTQLEDFNKQAHVFRVIGALGAAYRAWSEANRGDNRTYDAVRAVEKLAEDGLRATQIMVELDAILKRPAMLPSSANEAKRKWENELKNIAVRELAFCAEWWEKTRRRTIDAALEGVNETGEVSYRDITNLAYVYCLADKGAPEAKRAEDMLERINELTPKLFADVDKQVDSLYALTISVGQDADEATTHQQMQLDELQKNLDTLSDAGKISELVRSRRAREALQEMSGKLEARKAKLKEALADLNEFANSMRGDFTRLLLESKKSHDFQDLEALLTQYKSKFGTHALYTAKEKAVSDIKARWSKFSQELQKLYHALEREDFMLAKTCLDVLRGQYATELDDFHVSSGLTVIIENRSVKGIAAIEAEVTKHVGEVGGLMVFLGRIGVRDTGEALVWSDVRQKVSELVEKGDFDLAKQYVGQAVEQGVEGRLSLRAMLGEAETPPYPKDMSDQYVKMYNDATTPERRYEVVIAHATTQVWKAEIKKAQKQWQELRGNLRDADMLLRMVDEKRATWEASLKTWLDTLASVGLELRGASLDKLPKGNRKLQSLRKKLEEAFDSLMATCPNHPLRKDIEDNYLFQKLKNSSL
jgi:hypothetical protein